MPESALPCWLYRPVISKLPTDRPACEKNARSVSRGKITLSLYTLYYMAGMRF